MAEQIQDPEEQQLPPKEAESGDDFYMSRREDLEPKEFREGFSLKTIIGAFFVGIIMMPGAIYLGLMMGQSLGAAGQWTTIILFTEVARRSFTKLSRQEVYMIYYMAGTLIAGGGGLGLAGGAFAMLIWNQYLVQSPQARQFGITNEIPSWVVPHAGSPALLQRTFLHPDWAVPVLLLVIGQVPQRLELDAHHLDLGEHDLLSALRQPHALLDEDQVVAGLEVLPGVDVSAGHRLAALLDRVNRHGARHAAAHDASPICRSASHAALNASEVEVVTPQFSSSHATAIVRPSLGLSAAAVE